MVLIFIGMKNKNNQHQQTILPAAIVAIFLFGAYFPGEVPDASLPGENVLKQAAAAKVVKIVE